MTATQKPTKPQKPIKPIHRYLCVCFGLWLIYRLCFVPMMAMALTKTDVMSVLAWQVMVMLPAQLLIPVIIKGRSAYGLIVASLVVLIYLAYAGVVLFGHWYQKAPAITILGAGVELMLLLVINWLLFVIIKRLPPMHKQQREAL